MSWFHAIAPVSLPVSPWTDQILRTTKNRPESRSTCCSRCNIAPLYWLQEKRIQQWRCCNVWKQNGQGEALGVNYGAADGTAIIAGGTGAKARCGVFHGVTRFAGVGGAGGAVARRWTGRAAPVPASAEGVISGCCRTCMVLWKSVAICHDIVCYAGYAWDNRKDDNDDSQ